MDFKLIEVKDVKDDYQWLFSGPILLIWYVEKKYIKLVIASI